MQRRREFLQTGAARRRRAGLRTRQFWREALAEGARPGPGAYGPLRPSRRHAARLAGRFRSRVVARARRARRRGARATTWHVFPDGQATYADARRRLDPRLELRGAGLARWRRRQADPLRPRGRIRDAYRILAGTNINCSGGATPWGTWLSCEEVDRAGLGVRSVGRSSAVARPRWGSSSTRPPRCDPRGKRVYLTEDLGDGGLTASRPVLARPLGGLLEIASVRPNGWVTLAPGARPGGRHHADAPAGARQHALRSRRGHLVRRRHVYVATTAGQPGPRLRHPLAPDPGSTTPPSAPTRRSRGSTTSRSRSATSTSARTTAGGRDLVVITPAGAWRGSSRPRARTTPASELTGVTFGPHGRRCSCRPSASARTGAIFEVCGRSGGSAA